MWQLRGCFVPQSGHRFPQMLRPVVNVRFGKAAPQRRDPRSMSAMGRVFRKQSCGSPKADFSCATENQYRGFKADHLHLISTSPLV